jgi:hypothetical protein
LGHIYSGHGATNRLRAVLFGSHDTMMEGKGAEKETDRK